MSPNTVDLQPGGPTPAIAHQLPISLNSGAAELWEHGNFLIDSPRNFFTLPTGDDYLWDLNDRVHEIYRAAIRSPAFDRETKQIFKDVDSLGASIANMVKSLLPKQRDKPFFKSIDDWADLMLIMAEILNPRVGKF